MRATEATAGGSRSIRHDASPTSARFATGTAALGGTLLATCLCGIGRIVFGAAAAGTALASTQFGLNVYMSLIAASLALVLVGLVGRSRRAAGRAALGMVLFGAGLALAPPAAMHGMEHSASHLAGFGLALAGIGGIVWGFLTAFPTRNPAAATCAAGGFGAAVGCSCCLASGAATWLAAAGVGVTVPGAPFSDGIPYVLFMSFAILGLYRLGGTRFALLALAGAAVAFGGDEILKPFLADETERLPRLIVSFVGTAIVMWAFVQAFASTRPGEPAVLRESSAEPVGPGWRESEPERIPEPAGV